MTDHDWECINRRIARRLESEPPKGFGNSSGGLWQWGGAEMVPRPFHTDPAAMLALVEALKQYCIDNPPRRGKGGPGNPLWETFVNRLVHSPEGDDGGWQSAVMGVWFRFNPEAVTLAAAKALGIEA